MQKDMPQRRGKGAHRGPKRAYSSSVICAPCVISKDEGQSGAYPRANAQEYPLTKSEIWHRVERLQQLEDCSVECLPKPSNNISKEDKEVVMSEKKDGVGVENLVSKNVARQVKKVVRFSTATPEVFEFVVDDLSPCRRRERPYKDNFRLRQEPQDESSPTGDTKKFASLDQLMARFNNKQKQNTSGGSSP